MARSLASRAPVVVLATIVTGAACSVYYAHHQQRTEKQVMRAGVIRDIKRDRVKQRELQQQQEAQRLQSDAATRQ